ncbi:MULTISPECIES: hypothetical protein [Mycobacteriaceae]|uniref:Uncharacterized protein n=1 Tax=Mycolicibacillus parakoreensis TaxID=1069221 RepID=A0ABY3U4C6_9MYCO|nr:MULTISPECIES: hypothetical protein [Mycobacteriaceae]MCV7316203.1 hypothetical protein [Mycolicibacillus parakoreensis]ULN54804.1 hypothetical protein MIU77_18840 [Mycolicibacillus parakoreensis]
MTQQEQVGRVRSDTDVMWMFGIPAVLAYGVWQAVSPVMVRAAERRGLVWTDHGGLHIAPLAWVSLVVIGAAATAACIAASWVLRAGRERRNPGGPLPAPPRISAAVAAFGLVWVVCVVLAGPWPLVWHVTVAAAAAAAYGAARLAHRGGSRWRAVQLFRRAATDVLGFAEPGLGRVRAGRWRADDQPAAIRATTGPGWRYSAAATGALDRAAAAAGWHGPYQWRDAPAAAAVIGELIK